MRPIKQCVGHNRSGDGCLHQRVLPGAQRGQRDDQFGQVAQRSVEKATDGITRFGRHGLCRVTQQRGQRHNGQHGEHKKQRMRFELEVRMTGLVCSRCIASASSSLD